MSVKGALTVFLHSHRVVYLWFSHFEINIKVGYVKQPRIREGEIALALQFLVPIYTSTSLLSQILSLPKTKNFTVAASSPCLEGPLSLVRETGSRLRYNASV